MTDTRAPEWVAAYQALETARCTINSAHGEDE